MKSENVLSNLTQKDFELLDVIITSSQKILTIGLRSDNDFIKQENAYELYRKGEIVKKTIEIDGEPVFFDVK